MRFSKNPNESPRFAEATPQSHPSWGCRYGRSPGSQAHGAVIRVERTNHRLSKQRATSTEMVRTERNQSEDVLSVGTTAHGRGGKNRDRAQIF